MLFQDQYLILRKHNLIDLELEAASKERLETVLELDTWLKYNFPYQTDAAIKAAVIGEEPDHGAAIPIYAEEITQSPTKMYFEEYSNFPYD